MTVLDALRASRKPLTIAALMSATDTRHRREVEAELQQLRLAGHPILSDSRGVWISDDPVEVARCAKALRKRALVQLVTSRSLRETAVRMAPLTLFGDQS